mmetsp:Transcript_17178/g.36450  ORF Transcript_17178/g.36450 Transcript_17178/m.36450 type:complete len:209 (-) Transcript_17178:159-785(-)
MHWALGCTRCWPPTCVSSGGLAASAALPGHAVSAFALRACSLHRNSGSLGAALGPARMALRALVPLLWVVVFAVPHVVSLCRGAWRSFPGLLLRHPLPAAGATDHILFQRGDVRFECLGRPRLREVARGRHRCWPRHCLRSWQGLRVRGVCGHVPATWAGCGCGGPGRAWRPWLPGVQRTPGEGVAVTRRQHQLIARSRRETQAGERS